MIFIDGDGGDHGGDDDGFAFARLGHPDARWLHRDAQRVLNRQGRRWVGYVHEDVMRAYLAAQATFLLGWAEQFEDVDAGVLAALRELVAEESAS